MAQLYDQTGIGYASFRRPDPRLAAVILGALGEADSVVNVGTGAGSIVCSSPRPSVDLAGGVRDSQRSLSRLGGVAWYPFSSAGAHRLAARTGLSEAARILRCPWSMAGMA